MENYIIYLDDIREPSKHIINIALDKGAVVMVCRCERSFVNMIKENGCPVFISFDHDLGPSEAGDGYSCAKALGEMILNKEITLSKRFGFEVHSMNPVGAKNIKEYMKNLLKEIGD